jgi:molybdopterin/thiamine biosynthesis adenylyltransferase
VIGAGGLGSPAAMYLASAGVGRITLVDNDTVDLTNLQRQIAHTTERVGQSKAESARLTLQQINPEISVTALNERVDDARLPSWWPMPTWCWTAPTTSPPAMRSTAPAWRGINRWCRAR